MTEALRLTAVTKSFGTGADAVPVLHGVDLGVTTGSLVALLGPSGCGKTTLLRLVAGFDRPDGGTVEVDGQVVTGPGVQRPPERRRIGVVPQEGAVFPHLSVRGNIGFGLPRRDRRNGRVEQMLELVGLDGFAERMPHELSGGQLQRVALARALAPNPSVVLLDEPFAALDTSLRAAVRAEVRRVVHAAGATALLVTHDQEEALSMADEVAIMLGGRIVQQGSPMAVYRQPASTTVAEFLGDAVLLHAVGAGPVAQTALGPLVTETHAPALPGRVLIRPEQITLDPGSAPPEQAPALVRLTEFFGHDALVSVSLNASPAVSIRARVLGAPTHLLPGTPVRVSVSGPVTFFPEAQHPEPEECRMPE
jgi:iron(III) transport system ATP-binding protein